jgi:hypothetical protein
VFNYDIFIVKTCVCCEGYRLQPVDFKLIGGTSEMQPEAGSLCMVISFDNCQQLSFS